MEIRFALEHEFNEIVKCANKFFNKDDGYFETLVPILYKNGINTYKNHIVALKNNMIVGILAYKEIIQNDSKYIAIGTVCVDANCRGQGIMNQLFNFLFDNVCNNDGYVLIGNYDLYKRFGFEKSNDSLLHYFEKVNNYFTFKKINYDSDLTKSKKLYESIDYKVNRDNLILNIMMWCNEPYKIYISKTETHVFQNDFVFAVSCLTAHEFGQKCIDNGAISYLGYQVELGPLFSSYSTSITNLPKRVSTALDTIIKHIFVQSLSVAFQEFLCNPISVSTLKELFSYLIERRISELLTLNAEQIYSKYNIKICERDYNNYVVALVLRVLSHLNEISLF